MSKKTCGVIIDMSEKTYGKTYRKTYNKTYRIKDYRTKGGDITVFKFLVEKQWAPS